MSPCLTLILALVATPTLAFRSLQDESMDDADAKNRPVTKVINLLKDMVEQMEKEAEEDEEVYEAMGCWCETNDKAKTKAIADGEAEINRLVAFIEECTGNSARLVTEIANLEKEVAKNSDALDKATALRKKELAEFNAAEKEMLGTATSLKSAVVVLSKHHSAAASLIQTEASTSSTMEAAQVLTSLKHVMHKNTEMVKEMFTPHQRKKMAAFVQNSHHSLAPASGEIFGMLQAMKESVEQNLANAQKDEAESQADFESLKAAKSEEIAAGTELGDTKEQELATTDEKNAQSKESLTATRETLAADTKFLANLKEQCENMDQEFEERTKTRQGEIEACSKALSFLSSDEAHALFSKTLGFVQVTSTSHSHKRAKVLNALRQASRRFRDPRLSVLAMRAKIDAFTEVKKSISDMIEALKKEKQDEIKHKDFCVEELNANERDTEMKERDRADLEAKIDDLTLTVESLTKELEALKAEVADLTVQMKHAGEDREKQNKEFQTVVADQRATQKLLEAALGILKGFYEKAALMQERADAGDLDGQAPPPGFKSYEKNKKSGGVMGMMQGIIDEAKGLEAEAIRGEEDSQKAYEEFVQDTNDSLSALTKDVTSKTDMKAKAEQEKVEAETEHASVMENLESLSGENADLHKSCDFTLKNFDVRQSARDDEIEALKQALAMFSGASFSAFLQK
jgi:FtsZ-binding cell division protein ZapB